MIKEARAIPKTPQPQKSAKGCWTCKRRKIGCDKLLPTCQNCRDTRRVCEGYGLKLHWPDDVAARDGRRAPVRWQVGGGRRVPVRGAANLAPNAGGFELPEDGALEPYGPADGRYYFLNTTYEDILAALGNPRGTTPGPDRPALWNPYVPRRIQPSAGLGYGFETTINESEGTLIQYYTSVLSRMITTVDDSGNGFRTVLLPTALASNDFSSQSLLQAILALASFHRNGYEAAAKYKLNAIRLLSKALEMGAGNLTGLFATCMMLCVCDVFDSADGSWYTHLNAAKAIASQLNNPSLRRHGQGESDPAAHFLITWLGYHDVLSEFSHRKEVLPGAELMLELPSSAPEDTLIIGSLGCSLQLLQCISCINTLSTWLDSDSNPPRTLPAALAGFPQALLNMLQNLTQRPPAIITPPNSPSSPCSTISSTSSSTSQTSGSSPASSSSSNSTPLDATRILITANFYHLATLIYLHTAVLRTPAPAPTLQGLVADAIALLARMPICTSPWPLFVTACAATTDPHRRLVLDALDRMQVRRRIGNVNLVASLVQALWRRQDLAAAASSTDDPLDPAVPLNWRHLLRQGATIPSFI